MAERVRRVLVTGGTRGIGLAMVRSFSLLGYEVWACGKSKLDSAPEMPNGVRTVYANFEEPVEAVETVTDAVGAVDILVNNAGIGNAALLEATDFGFLRSMLNVNFVVPSLLMRAYVPAMAAVGWGRVVNIASISGRFGNAGRLAYASSKHALIGATRCVSDEFAGRGVTINAVCPGPTDTDMLRDIGSEDPGFIARMQKMLKIGRLVQPSEVAQLVCFLSGSSGAAITGQCLVIDGGVIQS